MLHDMTIVLQAVAALPLMSLCPWQHERAVQAGHAHRCVLAPHTNWSAGVQFPLVHPSLRQPLMGWVACCSLTVVCSLAGSHRMLLQ